MYIGVTTSSNIANTIHSTHVDIFGSRCIGDFFIINTSLEYSKSNFYYRLILGIQSSFQIHKNQINMAPSLFNCDCLKAKQCPCDTQEAILG